MPSLILRQTLVDKKAKKGTKSAGISTKGIILILSRVEKNGNSGCYNCKHRFCSSTDFVHIEQKWLGTATEIVVLTKTVAISTDFAHFGQKW